MNFTRYRFFASVAVACFLFAAIARGADGPGKHAPGVEGAGDAPAAGAAAPRPNVLWIVSEDNGPQLGAYGDTYAQTPRLDALAAKSLRYKRAWSNAPVCAPARTTIITGVYPTSTGGQHMRSEVKLPPEIQMFPQILREAGYYCTNNAKEDYNHTRPGKVWDESSKQAHYKNRPPGKPFFGVFNIEVSHESQIRRKGKPRHDLAKAPLPPYHPDTPEVRRDWAQYYDNLTEMDARAGKLLDELEAAGLAEDTIVFYYGDHGSGMPRSKRTPYDSGLRVPMIVHFPEKFRKLAPKDYDAGGESDRLVAFVDLAPTICSLADVKPPTWMQGSAFAGSYIAPAPEFLHGFRGRMDERIDLVRSVCDGRYVYVRNYMPHLPHGQHVSYQFQTDTTRVWKKLFDEGKLTPEQTYFWTAPRAPEELYDLQTDPYEVKNLAGSPDHQKNVDRLRAAQQAQVMRIRDVGFLPEGEMIERSKGSSPYEVGHDPQRYPLTRIMAAAELASMLKPQAVPELKAALNDRDSAVRYWAAMGILMRGKPGVEAAHDALLTAMKDPSVFVRIPAAQALGQYGGDADLAPAMDVLLDAAHANKHGAYAAVSALNAIDALGDKAAHLKEQIKNLPPTDPNAPARDREYVGRLIKHLTTTDKSDGEPDEAK